MGHLYDKRVVNMFSGKPQVLDDHELSGTE